MTRVILSCDSTPLGATAIHAATALAQRLNAELHGIYVEDINLVRTAQLPVTRELTSWSATARQLESRAMGNLFEWQAHAMRDALARAASALRLHWSFQIVRGAQPMSVFGIMREMDLAVFGHAGRFAPVLAPRSGHQRTAAPVMVYYDGTPAADRALAAALVLDTSHQVALVIATVAANSVATRARNWAASHHVNSEFVTLREVNVDAIRRVVQRYHAAALVWSSLANAADRKTLAALVDALPCPVIVVT